MTGIRGYRDDTGLLNWKLLETSIPDKLWQEEFFGKNYTENKSGEYTPTENDTREVAKEIISEITQKPYTTKGALEQSDYL